MVTSVTVVTVLGTVTMVTVLGTVTMVTVIAVTTVTVVTTYRIVGYFHGVPIFMVNLQVMKFFTHEFYDWPIDNFSIKLKVCNYL